MGGEGRATCPRCGREHFEPEAVVCAECQEALLSGRDVPGMGKGETVKVRVSPVLRDALISAGALEDFDEALLRVLKKRHPEQAAELLSAVTRIIEVESEGSGETKEQTVRRLATELRPGLLDHLGLGAAVEWQMTDFQARTGMSCQLEMNEDNIVADQECTTALFRIFQELLTNVAHHSEATSVNARLEKTSYGLMLQVEDNGKGISESDVSNPRSLGLLGMRERTRLVGGRFEIAGCDGKGTRVTVRVPVGPNGS